jgi:hypothetical protein
MLNVDEFPIAISQDQKIKEEAIKHLTAQLKEWRSKIIECENLIIQKNNELEQIDIAKTFKRSQSMSKDLNYDFDLGKKSFFQKFISTIYNFFHYLYKSFRKKNTVYIDFKKYPIDSRYPDRIDSVRQLDSDISKTQILNNSIAEINIKINFYAFKFALNYSQCSINGGLSFQTKNQFNNYFPKAIDFIEFYCDPKNLLCDYNISKEELGKFIFSYKFFYDISPNPTFDGISEIVSEEFDKVNSFYLKSLNTTLFKDKISENFLLLNAYADDLRDKEDLTANLVPDYMITCFNEANTNIHNYLDQGLPIPKDELVTLRNYNFLNNKLSQLKLQKSLGFQYDIRISNVANRIRSLVESSKKSINQGQESSKSLKPHNSFAAILLPAKLEQNQSISESPLIAGDSGFVKSGEGNRVRALVNQYEKAQEGVSKKNDQKLKKLASEAFDTQSPQSTMNRSVGIGVGRVFADNSSLKNPQGAKSDGKEVSV